jgi:hypothetical protein
MAVYTKRVQTVLSDDQFEMLTQLALEQGKPVSLLIREAVEEVYFKQASLQRRQEAFQDLLKLDAPVADWEQMEEEIIRGAGQ